MSSRRRRLIFPACVVVAFLMGCGLSFLFLFKTNARQFMNPAVAVNTAVTDFSVPLPDGETVVTVYDSQTNYGELIRMAVNRQGDTIKGVLPSVTFHRGPGSAKKTPSSFGGSWAASY